MSVDWQTVKSTITAQVTRLSELPATSVRWVDETGSSLTNGLYPIIWLRVSSIVSVGAEEERYEYSGNVFDGNLVNMCGQRQFTLSIRCESLVTDISDPRFAGTILEKVKIRLWRSTSREERAGSWTVAEYLGTKWFSYIEAGRPVTTYVTDLLCNTVDNDTDTTTGSSDWIGEALVSGPVKDTDGSTLGTVDVDADADALPED